MSYGIMITFRLEESVDPKSYWGLAHFDFHQSHHRKYRFVIPFLAAGVNWIIQSIAHLLRPGTLTGNFSLQFSFWIVNLASLAVAVVLAYPAAARFGIVGVAATFTVLELVRLVWMGRTTARYLGFGLRHQFVATLPGLAASSLAGAVLWAAS